MRTQKDNELTDHTTRGDSSLIPAGWGRTLGASFFKDPKLQIRRRLP
jgi:hypothetical protein